jgi:hypothetical protein
VVLALVSFNSRSADASLETLFNSGSASANPEARQNPETMMPEASAAKAKQLLGQMIEAMGGQVYLNVRELECAGRISHFGHNDTPTSFPVELKEYWRFPDQNRTDFGKKGNIIDVFSGRDGWTMDHDGVSEEPAEKLDEFQEQLLKNPGHLLRGRLKEEGLTHRYGGADLIDLKPVEWIELTDREERSYRIAVQRDNHLMVRFTVITRDAASGRQTEEVTSYSNYHAIEGVQTPFQVARMRDGWRSFQKFYDSCTYRPNLSSDFFTRAALEQRFKEVGSRADKKKAAKAKQD